MATVVLSNHKFPEDGQVTVPLPIPVEEYDHCMELLDVLGIGHATQRDCKVDGIDSEYIRDNTSAILPVAALPEALRSARIVYPLPQRVQEYHKLPYRAEFPDDDFCSEGYRLIYSQL